VPKFRATVDLRADTASRISTSDLTLNDHLATGAGTTVPYQGQYCRVAAVWKSKKCLFHAVGRTPVNRKCVMKHGFSESPHKKQSFKEQF
jgi:hypothetical protein